MKVNKLLIVSLPLIYSTNVFSNNSIIETSKETYFKSDNDKYIKHQRYLRSFENFKNEQQERIDAYYRSYISSNDNGEEVTVAKPLFEEIVQSLTNNNQRTDLDLIKKTGYIDLTNSSKKEKKEITKVLDQEYKRLNNQQSPNTLAKQDLLTDLETLSRTIKNSAENETFIIYNNKIITKSIFDVIDHDLRMITSVSQGVLAEMGTEIEDKFISIHSDLSQKEHSINENKKEINTQATAIGQVAKSAYENKIKTTTQEKTLGEVKELANKNRKNIDNQEETLDKVKEITNENKELVDKYLVNDFQVNGESKNLTSHFNSLYMESFLNRENINSVRNDFEHFKHETNNRFYKVEKRANQGIASVAAMSHLPFTDSATFSTAIGIGNYRNATALAWGMQYRINENIKVRASTAWNNANSFVSAGGVGISW